MIHRNQPPRKWARILVVLSLALAFGSEFASGQLFENLRALGNRLDVSSGVPVPGTARLEVGGPKGIASADFDGDGNPDLATANIDGSISVYFGEGEFSEEMLLDTQTLTLRDIVAADLTADGRPDIAVTAPIEGTVLIYPMDQNRSFAAPRKIETWAYARNLITGDFNADGLTDLVVAGRGLGLREYRGTAGGQLQPIRDIPWPGLTDVNPPSCSLDHCWYYLKPYFSLETFRRPGSNRDELAVIPALYSAMWVLSEPTPAGLQVQAQIQLSQLTYDLEIGKIVRPESESGPPDLIAVHRSQNMVELRRGGPGPNAFADFVQMIEVPLGPRDAEIVDLDGDGWNDLVVVARYGNLILTYHNKNGVLEQAHEMPVGNSPREMVVADFNADGQPDVAVVNRQSSDISILPGVPDDAGFASMNLIYLVDGQVIDVEVADLNADRHDDVVQAHLLSGDISVRLAKSDGSLEAPTFYPMGVRPNSLVLTDVDKDGQPDAIVASLAVRDGGGLAIRRGEGQGKFGPLRKVDLGITDGSSRLFGVIVQDFDLDGEVDIALGIYDCSGSHIMFLKGQGAGDFKKVNVFHLKYAAGMGIGDFDQDGDLDFAAVSGKGQVAVVESESSVVTDTDLSGTFYDSLQTGIFRATGMTVTDLNGDGDPDLLVASAGGLRAFVGTDGMGFQFAPDLVGSAPALPVSDVLTADLDANGKLDIAIACEVASCVTILTEATRQGRVEYVVSLTVDVPAGRILASGDLDGDGFPDLVGSGEVLWTALSSRSGELGDPLIREGGREPIDGVVINEILAINNETRLEVDGGKRADYVELYNGSAEAVSLRGWVLKLAVADRALRTYTFPDDAVLAQESHLLVIFSPTLRSEYHTGFRLPGDGASLTLLNRGDAVVDEVHYYRQFADVSYARFQDGVASFSFNPVPSPLAPNEYGGAVKPEFEFVHLDPPAPAAFEAIQFHGEGRDDIGIQRVSLFYRQTGENPQIGRLELFDVTPGRDDETDSDTYSGTLAMGLPVGVVEFYFEVEDFSGEMVTVPDGASFGGGNGSTMPYRFNVGTAPASLPRLEISEVVALNESGLTDELGGHPDWVELTNCSDQPLNLQGFSLDTSFPTDGAGLALEAVTLAPGERYVVFCDGQTNQGPRHAPFSLKSGGDDIYIVRATPGHPAGSLHDAVDWVRFGPQAADFSFAREGCGGGWSVSLPTPGAPNVGRTVRVGDVDANGVLEITDPVSLLGNLFLGWSPSCPAAGEVNGDGERDIADVIHLLFYLFVGGPAPVGEPLPVAECS